MTTTVLALVMAVMFAARTQAEIKPLVVVSISPYSELAADIDYLGALGDQAGASQQLAGLMQLFTGSQPTDLLNEDLPIGVMIGIDNDQFRSVAFLPVKDSEKLFGIIQGIARVEPEDAGDGVKKFAIPNGESVFVKTNDDWVFAGSSLDDLAEVPANPATMLGDLPNSYTLGVRAYLQNIPDMYRDEALKGLREGLSMPLPGEDEASAEARQAMMGAQMEAMSQLFDELDQLTLGFNIDAEDKSIYLDLSMSAVPGSDLASQMANTKAAPSRFGGFIREDALFSMNAVGEMSDAEIQAAESQMAEVREAMIKQMLSQPNMSDEDAEFLESWGNGIMDLISDTVKTGKGDFGMAVIADDHIYGGMGMHVASGAQAEALFDEFVEFIASKGEPVDRFLERDAETIDGVSFHTITPPTEGMGEEERAILGDNPVFAIGFGEDSVYLGFGTGIISSMEEMMEQSESMSDQPVAPFQMSASVASIVDFAAKVSPQAAAFAGGIQPGDDHIRITTGVDGVTSTTRIKVEEGVLRFLSSIGQQFTQMGGPIQ